MYSEGVAAFGNTLFSRELAQLAVAVDSTAVTATALQGLVHVLKGASEQATELLSLGQVPFVHPVAPFVLSYGDVAQGTKDQVRALAIVHSLARAGNPGSPGPLRPLPLAFETLYFERPRFAHGAQAPPLLRKANAHVLAPLLSRNLGIFSSSPWGREPVQVEAPIPPLPWDVQRDMDHLQWPGAGGNAAALTQALVLGLLRYLVLRSEDFVVRVCKGLPAGLAHAFASYLTRHSLLYDPDTEDGDTVHRRRAVMAALVPMPDPIPA